MPFFCFLGPDRRSRGRSTLETYDEEDLWDPEHVAWAPGLAYEGAAVALDSRAMLKMDIGLYRGIILWALSISFYSMHVFGLT